MYYRSNSDTLYFENVPLLRLTQRIPQTGYDTVDRFLTELSEASERFCRGSLFEALSADYTLDTDPQRRFRHRSAYELILSVASCDEARLVLELCASLKTPHGRLDRRQALTFSLPQGLLIPAKRVTASK